PTGPRGPARGSNPESPTMPAPPSRRWRPWRPGSSAVRHHGAHQPADEGTGQGLAADQQPVVDRAEEEVDRDLRVEIGPQLATLDATPEEAPDLGDAPRQHLLPEPPGKLAVDGEIRYQAADDAPVQPGVEVADHAPEVSVQRRSGVTEVAHRRLLLNHLEQRRQGQLLLRPPAPVDRGFRHPRPGRDALNRQPMHAAACQDLARCPQDGVSGRRLARPAPAGPSGFMEYAPGFHGSSL